MMYGFNRREVAIIMITAAIAFLAGLWVGVWSVPDSALIEQVPAEEVTRGDGTSYETPAYQPVPKYLPLLSVAIVAVAGWIAWHVTHPEEIEAAPEPATDGGGRE